MYKGKLKDHKLFWVLHQMKGRCYNIKNPKYKDYGERGIKVCENWRKSTRKFITWAINNGYREGLQIDRINNEDGYHEKNCRFVKSNINNQNRRSTILNEEQAKEIKYSNKNIKELSIKYSISISVIKNIKANRIWKQV